MIAVVGVIDIDMVPIVVAVYIWFGQKSYLRLLEVTVFFIVVLDVIVDISVVNDVVGALIVVADHTILNCGQ